MLLFRFEWGFTICEFGEEGFYSGISGPQTRIKAKWSSIRKYVSTINIFL